MAQRLAGAGAPSTSTGRAAGPLARAAHPGTAAASTVRRVERRATSGRGTSSSASASDAASRVTASARRCAYGFLSSGKIRREPGPARSWPSIDRAALSSRGARGSSRSRGGDAGRSSSQVATRSVSDPTVVTQSPESSSDEETDDGEGTREANRRVGTNGAGRPARSDAASGSGRVDAALKPRDAGSGRARYRKRRTSRERRWDRPIDERAELETDAKTGLGFARGAERRDARSDDDLFAATMTATNDDRASRSSESKSGWSSMRANASARSPASAEDAAVDGDLAGVGFGGLGGFSGGGGGGGNRGDGDGRRDRSGDRATSACIAAKR